MKETAMETLDPRQEREQSRRRDFRESILQAAEKVILREGFRATTMDRIAGEARLSKATLYHYFGGKTELIEEILLHFYDDMKVHFERIRELDISCMEKLRKTILTALQLYDEKKNLLFIIMSDSAFFEVVKSVFCERESPTPCPGGRFAAGWRDRYEELLDFCREILTEGVRRGEFRSLDIRHAVTYFSAVMKGYQHIRSLDVPRPGVHEEAETIFDFLTRGIAAPGRPIKGEA